MPVRTERSLANGFSMTELARIVPAIAVACPHCRVRLSDLPLDELAKGASYDCPECGNSLRMPQQVLEKLIAQREALAAEYPPEEKPVSFWQRWLARVKGWFR